jgi:hypothetical protein
VWARRNKVATLSYPARWKVFGKSAGPRRNELMVKDAKPDIALAFAGNNGTYDCVARCKSAGVYVVDVDHWWDEVPSEGP